MKGVVIFLPVDFTSKNYEKKNPHIAGLFFSLNN